MGTVGELTGRAVLVTGARGFLGGHLCRRLVALGAEVHGASRRPAAVEGEGVRWWQGDLGEEGVAERLVAAVRPAVVYHLASHVSGARDAALVLPTFRSNLASTVHLLAAVAAAGSGGMVVTGSLEEPDERADEVPASPYAVAKWGASAYARLFAAHYGTAVALARLFMVYGPAQPDPSKLVPYVIRSLLRGEAPAVSAGSRPVDWIYVDDVIEGLLALGPRAAELAGETVELGSGELVPVRGVVERLAAIVGAGVAPRFGAIPERPMERVRAADVDATSLRIGWRPRTPLDEGLERTVAWYRRHG